MSLQLQKKFSRLKSIIASYRSVLVAFSGGQDSALLLKAASLALPPGKVLAVTAVSATYPEGELVQAKNLARRIGSRLKIIRTGELKDKRFTVNSTRRCYFCKQELFSRLIAIAGKNGLEAVLEAGSLSDNSDYRPGSAAGRRLGVKSPLAEAGFFKQDIRRLSKKLGLSSWDKPSMACLASRIPYGTGITAPLLKRVDRSETYLRSLGLGQVRLRHYGDTCRIETDAKEIPRLLSKRRNIVRRLKKEGYHYITVDLEGYRTGSLNEAVKRLRRL
ncbi:MAG: ATP-dependent sacrificial sulfur transferase LarE [Candidatus Omnitrophica bacterium]|jgi:uncharacterized protein|nr:ATP-dependent sacrificial sulfur transferase LarE [Candidatus Omnitrophota bacterium]MDD3275384.1 ATP-dependent sacrificial sulfur transferase LarE [Candidatus Omnitrophota bacterium]MDD5077920.1 ATP-dependent sacrificial sulfur transferase LarE [Candidatus Omnitrophota bacterium]MDD5725024.1 ATP-dependent sacrificial sulfur transferase LarE [Candidatus Omnitrophota bacterium]